MYIYVYYTYLHTYIYIDMYTYLYTHTRAVLCACVCVVTHTPLNLLVMESLINLTIFCPIQPYVVRVHQVSHAYPEVFVLPSSNFDDRLISKRCDPKLDSRSLDLSG